MANWTDDPQYCGTVESGCPDQWIRYGTERFCHRYGATLARECGINIRCQACRQEFPVSRPEVASVG